MMYSVACQAGYMKMCLFTPKMCSVACQAVACQAAACQDDVSLHGQLVLNDVLCCIPGWSSDGVLLHLWLLALRVMCSDAFQVALRIMSSASSQVALRMMYSVASPGWSYEVVFGCVPGNVLRMMC